MTVLQSNIDNVRARIMELEGAAVFDQRAWAEVLMQLSNSPCQRADAARRMETAKLNSQYIGGLDCGASVGDRQVAADVKLVTKIAGTGHSIWSVSGRRVETWSDYDRCLRCGRPLRSATSRARGYGQECEAQKMFNAGPVAVLVVSAETEVTHARG